MSKNKKIILGIATIFPIAYMIFFFLFIFFQIFITFPSEPTNGPPAVLMLIFPLHFLTMILSFILIFIYIKNVFGNENISQDKKPLWAVVLFLGNFVAMPIYWYLYIWKESEETHLTDQSIQNNLT